MWMVENDFISFTMELPVQAETSTQTQHGERKGGRCGRKGMLRKHCYDLDDEDQIRHSYKDRKKLRRKAKKWMRKMMWRKMMLRMCYGMPAQGFGFGCRGRRMMAAMMDTSSDDSDGRREWRHRRCHKRWRSNAEVSDQQGPDTEKEVEEGNGQGLDGVLEESGTGNGAAKEDSGKQGRSEGRRLHWKENCKHRRHRRDTSSGTSSSSSDSSSESSSDEAGELRGKEIRRRFCRRRRIAMMGAEASGEAAEKTKEDGMVDKRKGWKGKKCHKKMMKRMKGKGFFRRFR